MRKGMLV